MHGGTLDPPSTLNPQPASRTLHLASRIPLGHLIKAATIKTLPNSRLMHHTHTSHFHAPQMIYLLLNR